MASAPARILIVDDESSILSSLRRDLEDDYECIAATSAEAAREAFSKGTFACIISDQRMPGENGAQLLAWVRRNSPDTSRILLTGYSDFDSVVEAVNAGGIQHFLNKPWEPAHLLAAVRSAVEHHRLIVENRDLQRQLQARNAALENENRGLRETTKQESEPLRALAGISPAMQKLKTKLAALGDSQSTVLITGESGTGKELAARALHFAGSRKDKPFIALNCAALPESILESELFGHMKGAFTHATENRVGLLEAAHGGTLFLDEIGDMPLGMQAKVLRFLQEGVVTPVGGRQERKVDVRVIAATHRDLEAMVEEKTFRQDLFYRLNVIPLRTPALRDRPEDIPLLAEHFITKLARKMGRPAPTLATETKAYLQAHAFPGNVRELENAVEYALNMAGQGAELLPEHLPDRFLLDKGEAQYSQNVTISTMDSQVNGQHAVASGLTLDDAVSALEKEWIERALRECEGNISQTARRLGLSRQGLHNKLAKYGLSA